MTLAETFCPWVDIQHIPATKALLSKARIFILSENLQLFRKIYCQWHVCISLAFDNCSKKLFTKSHCHGRWLTKSVYRAAGQNKFASVNIITYPFARVIEAWNGSVSVFNNRVWGLALSFTDYANFPSLSRSWHSYIIDIASKEAIKPDAEPQAYFSITLFQTRYLVRFQILSPVSFFSRQGSICLSLLETAGDADNGLFFSTSTIPRLRKTTFALKCTVKSAIYLHYFLDLYQLQRSHTLSYKQAFHTPISTSTL